mmetsp:Transcript_74748/g.216965  ORF Transcript_74748/g.216965 Transcript_74748/m.216965 type:complete len:555 (-) Transcript_74748:174-1838(-)
MGGASSFIAMLSIAAFLGLAWLATKLSQAAGVSSIVLEITTGVVFGPAVLGLVAPEYAECQHARHINCDPPQDLSERIAAGKSIGEGLQMIASMGYCPKDHYDHGASHGHDDAHGAPAAAGHNATEAHAEAGHDALDDAMDAHGEAGHDATGAHAEGADHAAHRRLSGGGVHYATYEECLVKNCQSYVSHECQLTPDFFTLIGHAGVALMIFESGMHFDFEKAAQVGPRACCVAVIGTILPLVSGAILTVIFGRPFMPDGVSVGTALAPTSVGIALRLLGEARVLQQDFGQAIITAAFVDDILSLVLFNILFSLKGEFNVMSTVVNPIIGIAFMAIAMAGAVKFWPRVINEVLLPKIRNVEGSKSSRKDEALFFLMVLVLLGYATITFFLGTHLWGCFIAGMSFACLSKDHHAHHVWVRQTKRVTSWMIRIFFAATVAFAIPIDKLLSFEAFWKGSLMGLGPCILSKVVCAPFMGPAKWVIGWAMVGRAEFAYLIAQMAAAANMVDAKTFSIVIWALLYATIFAPFVFRKVLQRYVAQYCQDEAGKEELAEDVH